MNAQEIIDEIRGDLKRVFDVENALTPMDLFENVRGYIDELSDEELKDGYFASLKEMVDECLESVESAYSTFADRLFELTEVSWDEDILEEDDEEVWP
jgi:hypothetical protein